MRTKSGPAVVPVEFFYSIPFPRQKIWPILSKTDWLNRALGLPAWEMLGGKVRERVRSYAWIGGDRPDEIAEAAEVRRNDGVVLLQSFVGAMRLAPSG